MCTCRAAEHGNPSWAERTELDCDLGSGWCVCERIPEEEPWRKQEETAGKAISAGRAQPEGRQDGCSIGSHWRSGGEPPGRDGLWFTGKNALMSGGERGHGVRRVGQRMMVAGREAAGGKENARVGAQKGCMRMCVHACVRTCVDWSPCSCPSVSWAVWFGGNAYCQINPLGSWHIVSWGPSPSSCSSLQSSSVGVRTC